MFNGIIDGGYEGQLANIKISVGSDTFCRRAVAVPGAKIDWTVAMSVAVHNREEWEQVHRQSSRTMQLPEEDTHYFHPE